ncbi:DnaD domain protein, partial [Streptococcus pneumoniae]|nr:DnaD domain protein [Streptococcus pneumoniae]
FLEQVPEMVGSETASARRVRKFRENQLALQCNNDVTKRNGDIDIEKDIDTEIEKENNKTMVSSSLSENLKHSGIRINDKQH